MLAETVPTPTAVAATSGGGPATSPEGTARALSPGVLVHARFRIDKILGQGAMGAVYLVRDTTLADRPCAMKEMLDYSHTPDERAAAVRRFLAEAETLATLNHPGIPQVYDRFIESGRYYLAMEFVAGVDLGKVLEIHRQEHGRPLPEREVATWALQICDVLEYLHGNLPPVVHRDLKPANVILTRNGRVKVVDFGIAKAGVTARGTSIGTHGYAPPEQYRGQAEPRSDLYALGATLHHLLTGRDPNLQAPFDYPPPTRLVPELNPQFEAVIMRLLSLAPEDRPASAESVEEALTAAFPGMDPYRNRNPDPLVSAIILRKLGERLGLPPEPGRPTTTTPSPASPSPATEEAALPARCPVCDAGVVSGRKFCKVCGVRLVGTLPRMRLCGSSTDLSLRLPPGYWEKSRVERVTLVDDSGAVGSGTIVGVMTGDAGQFAYVARGRAGTAETPAAGAPVEVYLREQQGEESVLTAIPAGAHQLLAEAVRLWHERFIPSSL
jgi:serine/threonine protein kinase